LKNGGSLQKDGYILYGWLIDNMVYLPGDTFIMKNREVTAIAIWVPADLDNDVFVTISFNGNGSTGGTVPESISCPAGQGAVLPHNIGNLTRPGYVFGGWTDNVKLYLPGQTYYMENSVQNTTLYAVWVPARTFSYNGNLNTGGSVPVDPVPYGIGETVTILDNVNNLTRDNHLFAGWFVRDRIYQPGEIFTIGAEDTVASAVWVSLNETQESPEINTPPKRKAGVPDVVTADAMVGDVYSVDLSDVFEDTDGDPLTYYVSVNGSPFELVSPLYEYTATDKGNVLLVFIANDGKVDSDIYSVILTINEESDTPETPVPNTMPNRKAEVPNITTADAIKGDIFTLNLSDIFEDLDGDSLIYYVSVNGSPYEATSALYDYALTGTGTITLIFRASDGKSESTDTYTVIITVQKGSGDSSGGSSGGGSNPSGGGSGGGSSGGKAPAGDGVPSSEGTVSGGSDSTGVNSEVISTGNTVTVITTISSTIDQSGKAAAEIQEGHINSFISKAVDEAEQSGSTAKVEIKLETPDDTAAVEVTIPQSAINSIAGNTVEALTLSTTVADITFDQSTLSTIADEALDDVRIAASKVNPDELSEEARQLVGDRPVFEFRVASGDKVISKFGGNVTVNVPYTPKPDEDINAIVIYYINAEGKLETVTNCVYDPETGTVRFTTNHFSKYAVGYNKVSFKDVAKDAWYSKAVSFIAARGITSGTGNGNFSPEAKLTRAQFIVMLMKAYGIEPEENSEDNFADAGNTYYTGYLAAAKRLGITAGIGNNMFGPNREITRQEMFTMLYNALKAMGKLSKAAGGKSLSSFMDAGDVASWAKDAITYLVEEWYLSGSNGRILPNETTTRAQMAQVLYSLLVK